MAKETKITRKQFNVLLEKGLIVPWGVAQKKREIASVLEKEIYAAKSKGDTVRAEQLNETLSKVKAVINVEEEIEKLKISSKHARIAGKHDRVATLRKQIASLESNRSTEFDNLVFARFSHPTSHGLLLSQSDDETETMGMGFLYAPRYYGDEDDNFVLDLGKTITLRGSDNTKELKLPFEYGDVHAMSEDAAKNWKTGKTNVITYVNGVEQKVEQVVSIKEYSSTEETAKKTKKTKKAKGNALCEGQLFFAFEETSTLDEIFDVVVGEIQNDTNKDKEGVFLDNVVVAKKIIPTAEYILDVELVFYSRIERRLVPATEDGILVRNEDNSIKMNVVEKVTPSIDCRIFAYESDIDMEMGYEFDTETIETLKEVEVLGKSLVVYEDDGRVYLHSLNTAYENDELETLKETLQENLKKQKNKVTMKDGTSVRINKSEYNGIVSFADFSRFLKKRELSNLVV